MTRLTIQLNEKQRELLEESRKEDSKRRTVIKALTLLRLCRKETSKPDRHLCIREGEKIIKDIVLIE